MRDTSLSFNSVDPLSGYEGIALLPQTFGSDLPPVDTHDLVHNHLKSMALQSPNKLLQQAKTILDDSSELLNLEEVPSDILSQGNKEVDANDNEIHRERRPGIGRKRARFSLKPNSSQPTVSLEPNLDINELKDPEEFFMAYERHENATREIQKHMGSTFVDFDQQNPSMKPRQRRPGILGPNRRTVKYKHFHSLVLSDGNEAPISSKEIFEQDILSPTQGLHQGTSGPSIASQSQELDGSMSMTEKKFDGLLDELLSTRCEDLDGDEALVLLQEHLQIKPMVLEKLSLPDLRNIRMNDPKAFDGKSPKPRQVLVDMQNLFGGASCKLPAKYKEETVVQNMGSPTPPRNPFASLLGLKKHVLQLSEPLGDQHSFSVVDTSLTRNASPVDFAMEQSDLNDTLKDLRNSSVSKSLRIVEDDNIVAEPCYPKVTRGDSPNQNEKSEDEIRLCSSSELKSLRTEEYDNTVAEPSIRIITTGDSPDQNGKSGDDDSRNIRFGNNFGSRSHVDLEGHIGGSGIGERVVNESLSMSDADVDFRTEEVSQDNVGDVPEAGVRAVEEPNNTADHLDKSSVAASKDHTIGGPLESVDIGVEEQHLEMSQEPSDTSKNEQSKSKLHPGRRQKRKHTPQMQNPDGANMSREQEYLEASRDSLNEQTKAKLRKRKDSSKRQSLAGAGTKWEGGVRRSTRFRTRPLEYWKGERLLYGRIHDSMFTVIGMKYVSPAKGNGNPTVKVKQIVSGEYKELVDRAAWH